MVVWTPLSSRPARQLILVILGICQNCHVRNKEITTEVILFEYSRRSNPISPSPPLDLSSGIPSGRRLLSPRKCNNINCWQPRGREMPWTEIMLWATPEVHPRALQTSECRELLNPTRASCLILAQRQPGKLPRTVSSPSYTAPSFTNAVTFTSSLKQK